MKNQTTALLMVFISAFASNNVLSRIALKPSNLTSNKASTALDKKAARTLAIGQYEALITKNSTLTPAIKAQCSREILLNAIDKLYENDKKDYTIDESAMITKIGNILETMINTTPLLCIPRDILFAHVMLTKQEAQRLMREEFNRWITANDAISQDIKSTLTFRPLLEVIEQYYSRSSECDLGCLTLSLWDTLEGMVNSANLKRKQEA